MSDTESVDYLQTDFDPWSLTVPRLRSILVTHNIHYPSQAKKPQLVDLFNEHVLPQSRQLLASRSQAKRSSRGIVDADSQSTTSADLNDEPMPPPPSARRSRSPRKTTRVKREPEDADHPTLPPAPLRESPRKRSSRSVSVQPPPSDTDTGPEPEPPKSVRRERRVTPAPKLEPPEEEDFFRRTPETAAVFSTDNPFQSGANSPMSPLKTPTNRRKTAGLEALKYTPSTARRRTDGYEFSEPEEPATVTRNFEIPMSRVTRSKTPEVEVEIDEEFTPEEQLALDQEEAAHPEVAVARRAAAPRPKRRTSLATPFWVFVTTLLVAYAAWYRQEKLAVGYCGLGREPTQLIPSTIEIPEWATEAAAKFDIQIPNIEVPDWLTSALEPQCETCPPHAYCYEDFTARCEPDFILKPHPLSLGGLVPVPPTCEPDGEKVRRVQAVADKAVEELRDRRAKYECGEPLEPEGEPLDSPAIEEQELKEILNKKRSKRMAAEEFDELWTAAIGEVKAREEVEVHQEESDEPA